MPEQAEKFENIENRQYLDRFLNDPQGEARKIEKALKSGNLAYGFAAENLAPLMREADNVNEVNRRQNLMDTERKIEQLKSALFSQLNLIDTSNHDQIIDTVRNFCEERNLEMHPKPGNTICVRPDLVPDWISDDQKTGIIVNPSTIWVYEKFNNMWYPANLE